MLQQRTSSALVCSGSGDYPVLALCPAFSLYQLFPALPLSRLFTFPALPLSSSSLSSSTSVQLFLCTAFSLSRFFFLSSSSLSSFFSVQFFLCPAILSSPLSVQLFLCPALPCPALPLSSSSSFHLFLCPAFHLSSSSLPSHSSVQPLLCPALPLSSSSSVCLCAFLPLCVMRGGQTLTGCHGV